ncbi:ISL2 isoform 2 [Pan troglodytes]|uniref:ISL2 isoform 2 n=1 Tax=Pan troglodytes TaxID=9598 RepID=A0A2J8KSG0_PANTR|nr:ISL2 isoform 2 [Pan troglodytes]
MVDIIFHYPFLGAMGDHSKKKPGTAMCVGCGSQIHDQFILRVSPDLEWHAACLKCAECSQYLDETCTCFVRDGKTYCKRDYVRRWVGPAARVAPARAQADGEDDPRADCAEREAAAHSADLLRRQPATRRSHEGAAGGDDRPEPAGHPRLVPEQALQGQEEIHSHEAAAAAAAQRQDEPSGTDWDAPGGGQSHPP